MAACALGAIALLLGLGCQDRVCLEGTIERDDGCVPADGVSPEADSCGPGTEYSPSEGACVVVEPPTQCGPNTVEEVSEDGTVVCVGVGGGSCDQPIACPQPADGTSLCGWIRDAESGQPVVEGDGTDTSACVPGEAAEDGPCALEVFVFDAIQFATAPEDAEPLAADELTIDRCGRFRVVNAPVPSGGIIAVTTDDSTAGEADAMAHAGIASRAAPGLRVTDRDLLAVRRETDQAWTASAGDPFDGTSLVEKGVALVTFRRAGEPAAGVTATVGGSPEPADDFYFQADEDTRTTIDPAAESTGSNGTALMFNIALQMLSGQGQESDGCAWDSELAATPANTVFVAERVLVDGSGDECR
jgi:hypothetical protein